MSQQTPGRPENKMGTMPIQKLLISMSGPMILSMLVQAMYNVVDSIFVSYISEDALTAVSLAFPVQNFMIAVSVGIGVGINALLSRSLGQKDYDLASKAANNGIFINIISSLLFALLGIFGSTVFFKIQLTDPEIIAYGHSYLFWVCIFSFGLFGQVVFTRLLQSTGQTFYCMIIQIVGAVANIILDPILIFGMFGLPRLEVAGAAIATVLSQIIGTGVGLYLNLRFNKEISLSLRDVLKPSLAVIHRINSVGIPTVIMLAISSVMIFGFNQVLVSFTKTASAVFGVYFKLQSFIIMPVVGLNNGMVPIIAYNYGAGRPERIVRTIKLSIIYAVGIMAVGFAVFQIFPKALLGFFQPSPEMLAIGIPALRIISICFIMAGYCIVCSSVFQALGKGVMSMVISIIRQLLVLLPAAYLLSLSGRLDLVWWAFPIAELSSGTLATIFLIRSYKNTIKPLSDPGADKFPFPAADE